jgi:hypothetical protein
MKTKLIIQTRIKELKEELQEVIEEIKKLKSDSVSGQPDFKQMETVDSFTKRVLSLKFAIVELEGITKLIDGEINDSIRINSGEDV